MENVNSTTQALESSVKNILAHFDTDPDREGLCDTPRRYVKFLTEFMKPSEFELTEFDGEGYDQMVIQTGIQFHSLCEHHLAPFYGIGHIAYIPNGKVVGLSKLARTLEKFASRFQNQERISRQVAQYLNEKLQPKGVAVVLRAKHMCMGMRGVRKHGASTITSEVLGVFREDALCRNEFFQLIQKTSL
jgi:GTP cyclohydrolase I